MSNPTQHLIDQADEMALALGELAEERRGDAERGLRIAAAAARSIVDTLEEIQCKLYNFTYRKPRRRQPKITAPPATSPKPRAPHVDRTTAAHQLRELLAEYVATGEITTAAKRVGINVTRHYYAIYNDPAYAAAFAQARDLVAAQKPKPRMTKASREAAAERGREQRERVARDKRAFLAAYAQAGSVCGAERLCGVRYQAHGKWLRRDLAYAAAFAEVCADAGHGQRRARQANRSDALMTPDPLLFA